MIKKFQMFLMISLFLMFFSVTSYAAIFNSFIDEALFNTATSGSSLLTQDYQSFSHGDDLTGFESLPGVNVTSNMENIVAWGSSGDVQLFSYDSTTRSSSIGAYYDINLSQSYNIVGFDIGSWDPQATGAGYIEVSFNDSTTQSFNIFQTGTDEVLDEVFFGIVSDVSINRIRFSEAAEVYGAGNEETTLDDIRVGNAAPVPEPSTLLLIVFGVLGLAGVRKIKKP